MLVLMANRVLKEYFPLPILINIKKKNNFNMSSNECVSTDISTLFVLGDDAYSLKINLLKPYSRLNLTEEEWIFNYWMSRVLRCIERAFGS